MGIPESEFCSKLLPTACRGDANEQRHYNRKLPLNAANHKAV
jgi:hypothetical protein